ncbi:MAG: DUF721 domain-containing protein [Phycisphaerales bacterium]|nr:DUF721 domain-containing protein [Phycisphaerales bacterium]
MNDLPHQSSSNQPSEVRTSDALSRLRGFRVYPDRARPLGNDLDRALKSLRLVSQSEQAGIEAWNTIVPDAIREQTDALGLDRGRLIVRVPSAAIRYKADTWLRSGGLGELQALARVPIRSVQMKIVAQNADPEGDRPRIEK